MILPHSLISFSPPRIQTLSWNAFTFVRKRYFYRFFTGFESFGMERWQVILANCILFSFVLSVRCLKLENGSQRWRTTGNLGRVVKWDFQAAESKIQEPSLFCYNLNESINKGGGHYGWKCLFMMNFDIQVNGGEKEKAETHRALKESAWVLSPWWYERNRLTEQAPIRKWAVWPIFVLRGLSRSCTGLFGRCQH